MRTVRRGLREVDKRRGWRGPIETLRGDAKSAYLQKYGPEVPEKLDLGEVYPALVTAVNPQGMAALQVGIYSGSVDLKKAAWARKRIDAEDRVSFGKPEAEIKPGQVIEISVELPSEGRAQAAKERGKPAPVVILDQTPQLEGALTLIDPHSGRVSAVVGGYSYRRSQFNRVTQSLRQPGSTFKPVVYLSAIDGYRYTPATIVHDTEQTFRVGNDLWTPGNFDGKFMGAITLRTALEKSRNLVSAEIVSRIGVDAVIRYARKLGIESKIGRNPSIALGSSEVTLLELTRAYGVFAAKGVLFKTVFVTKIVDREGRVVYDYENEKLSQASQAINENSAFIMANLMKGVVTNGTGYKVKALKRPVAGKTGTSNDQMDAWFIGYTPEWVCGVWTGFDVKRSIGEKETGGMVAAPIFLYFMQDFLAYQDRKNYETLAAEAKAEAARLGIEYVPPDPEQLAAPDFSVPDGVDPFWVNRDTGLLSKAEAPNAIYEYFIRGTEPLRSQEEQDPVSYLESPDL